MSTLFHLWLHPFSRKVRIVLAEKKLEFDLKIEKVWERRTEFLALNPAGDVPVLVESDGTTLANSQVVCEYLEEVYPQVNLLGTDPVQRADPALAHTRLVALSGYGQPEDRRRTAAAGFDSHLVKPVELETLNAVLDRS